MFFILLILFVGLGSFANYLFRKFRNDRKYNRKFYDFGSSGSIVYTALICLASYFAVNAIMEDPVFTDPDEQISYGKSTSQPWLASRVYEKETRRDTFDLDLLYNYIASHFDSNQDMGPSERAFDQEGTRVHNYYTYLSESPKPEVRDIGELGLGLYYHFRKDLILSQVHLTKVVNQKLKYLHTFLGVATYYHGDSVSAESHFFREIMQGGDSAGAYRNLAITYHWDDRAKELASVVYNENAKEFVPGFIRTRVYIENRDIKNYFLHLFSSIFKNTNVTGFIGALLILLLWIMYITRVNVYFQGKWGNVIFAVLLSSVLVLPVWLLYDWYEHILGFDLNGEPFNDFLYCVFGIGVIEELVKFIPFLIILKCTKAVKEPIDYIMYASLSALGFAFVENFRYFGDGNLHIIHSRALTASVAHMCLSSIVAYGLILAKFKTGKHTALYFIAFFLIAAFAHGFYDFWLISPAVESFSFITFIFLLTGMLAYASFINNALNNSLSSGANINLDTLKLSSDLAAGFLLVFLFEFVALCFIYGPTIGNRELLSSTISGGYLILFASIRLSNIDIFPGDWAPIDFFVGLMPHQVISGDRKPNFNSLTGKRIRLRSWKLNGVLSNILPCDATIIRREKISSFTGWFLVKLDKPFFMNKKSHEYILVRAKEKQQLIGSDSSIVVSFMMIPDMERLENQSKRVGNFVFLEWARAELLPDAVGHAAPQTPN
jgi:RsiW-degrading membrane proteinase PrsW (M82 family)